MVQQGRHLNSGDGIIIHAMCSNRNPSLSVNVNVELVPVPGPENFCQIEHVDDYK